MLLFYDLMILSGFKLNLNKNSEYLNKTLIIDVKTGEINAKHIVAWAHHALNIPIHIKLAKELEEIKKMFTVILGVFPNVSGYIFFFKL